jgi:redox-sensitive bicupin YhaK (pirin superfamily)
VLEAGSIEWMQAGGGVWHGGAVRDGETVRGYQLWVALPPHLELADAESRYLEAATIEDDGRARLLLGTFGAMRSAIPDVSPMTYVHVRLRDGESWRYVPPADHQVAWLAVNEGRLHVAGAAIRKQMAVFEEGNGSIELRAEGDTELVLGSAVKHPHALVCGSYSVHTSKDALSRGEAGIRSIAAARRVT